MTTAAGARREGFLLRAFICAVVAATLSVAVATSHSGEISVLMKQGKPRP